MRTTIEEDAGISWRANGMDLTKNGHGVWAYLSVTNISHSTIYKSRLYAQFMDGSGRECFSLLFSQEVTATGERSEPFQPQETRILLSTTGSIFPSVPPVAARLHALPEVPRAEPTLWLEDGEVISVPPTIMGGIAGSEGVLPTRNYESPYLGFASLVIDSKGSLLESTVTNATAADVRDAILTFIKSLRFNSAISRKSAVPSRLFILFVRQDSKSFSDDSSWPWGVPWVADAVQKSTPGETVPVVAELAFEARTAGPEGNPGFEYLPLGSDWCPDLFTWTNDPGSRRPVRRWDPGWALKNMRVLPRE